MNGDTPHDRLFKATFSQLEEARGLLATLLPAEVVARIDWQTLTPMPGTFVDRALKFRHTDLLFGAALDGKDARIYVLVEHQSSQDRLMPFRLLAYVTRVLEKHIADAGSRSPLPVVVPVLISHAQGAWKAARDVAELFDIPDGLADVLAPYLPRLRYLLDDLHATTEEALAVRDISPKGKVTLMALRESRVRAYAAAFQRWAELLALMQDGPEAIANLSRLLAYVLHVSDEPPWQVVDMLTLPLRPDVIEGIMTSAEQLIEEGRQEGLERGRAQGREEGREEGQVAGKAAVLEKLIALKFGGLSDVARARLDGASAELLDRWSDRILSAETEADLFAE